MREETIYVGIDPGLSGGIVVINNKQEILYKNIMPVIKGKKTEYDIQSLVTVLGYEHPAGVLVVLEKQHVRPVSGKRACFMTGFGYGLIRGIIERNGYSYEIVNPIVWMKDIFKGFDYKDKKASVMFCKRKWPKEDWKATDRCKILHTGLTDAACIALYCFRMNKWSR